MKRRLHKLKKVSPIYFIPLIIIFIIVSISTVFANLTKENAVETMGLVPQENQAQTGEIKMIKVYFHDKDEVQELPLEEYLLGVIPAEMPPSFEMEALKAQAIAARTFIINRERANNEESLAQHKGGSICTDPNHCKAYIDEAKLKEKWGEEWTSKYKVKIATAVNETKGMIITYDGEPISAVFHSTSSGKTENSEDVWQSSLPYLRSVVSEGEEKSPRYKSKAEFTLEQFKSILIKQNSKIKLGQNTKDWIGIIEYTDSGSVKTVILGGEIFKGTEIRTLFSLRSTNFKIQITDKVIFEVTGNGHGVGMSQYGANYAAENGSNYKQILQKYYQGVEIEKIY